MQAQLILLNKPCNVLSQFTDDGERSTLREYVDAPGFYPAGRLDYDSEGLILLTDNGVLQARITQPQKKMWKRYLVQVEGDVGESVLTAFRQGLELADGLTRPARAVRSADPHLWPRNPPIRERRNKPVSWLDVQLQEGRNRQVRRMTAALGHPTVRLVRLAIGDWILGDLKPGELRRTSVNLPSAVRGRR